MLLQDSVLRVRLQARDLLALNPGAANAGGGSPETAWEARLEPALILGAQGTGVTRSPPRRSDTSPLSRPLALSPESPGDAPCSLLTFMGHTVHGPLVRGVKGGEGAAGGPGRGRLLHHRGWLDEAAVQGVFQVMVGHCEGKELLSVPVLPNPWSPLPSFLLGVRDSTQDMGTPRAAQSHRVPQPNGHRNHQPAVVVTSPCLGCGQQSLFKPHTSIYPPLQLPKLRMHVVEGQATQILGPMRTW